jgi:hypothetical protein
VALQPVVAGGEIVVKDKTIMHIIEFSAHIRQYILPKL